MITRSEVIARIDAETDRLVAAEGRQNRNRYKALAVLVFAPPLTALFKPGTEGIIDRWAFRLTLEAKRYERDFGDDSGPKSIAGSFLR